MLIHFAISLASSLFSMCFPLAISSTVHCFSKENSPNFPSSYNLQTYVFNCLQTKISDRTTNSKCLIPPFTQANITQCLLYYQALLETNEKDTCCPHALTGGNSLEIWGWKRFAKNWEGRLLTRKPRHWQAALRPQWKLGPGLQCSPVCAVGRLSSCPAPCPGLGRGVMGSTQQLAWTRNWVVQTSGKEKLGDEDTARRLVRVTFPTSLRQSEVREVGRKWGREQKGRALSIRLNKGRF